MLALAEPVGPQENLCLIPSERWSFFSVRWLFFLLHSSNSALGRLPLQLPQRWLPG